MSSDTASASAADAYESAVVLSDHIDANHSSSIELAPRTRNHTDAVRVQAVAIARAVRAVKPLDACIELNRKALLASIYLHAAPDTNIQGDDGDLSDELRLDANDGRRESSVAVAVADTFLHQATSLRKSFIDSTPPENSISSASLRISSLLRRPT